MTSGAVTTADPDLRAPRPGRSGPRPVQRHPVDLVRVALGLAVLGLGLLVAQRGRLPVLERDLFQLVNDLPATVFPVVWVVMQLGNVVAVPEIGRASCRERV